MRKFPDKFFFGAAISSHQVEGECNNNWRHWELQNCQRLADDSFKMKNVYSGRAYIEEASLKENYISGKAVDHYNRFESDFKLASKIGLNSLRFSIEWSRIEPQKGIWEEGEISHYREVIEELKANNMEPFVTIWHWTLPLWLYEKGGVLSEDFPEHFERFTECIAKNFKGLVKFYITINEPEIFSFNSFFSGKWPPQKKGPLNYLHSMKNLKHAHNRAYKAIKSIDSRAYVGVALNMTSFEAKGLPGHILKFFGDRFWNGFFIEKIQSDLDFIGLNYYFHKRFFSDKNNNESKNNNERLYSDMGWELYPWGISSVLEYLQKYNLPVYVTENGLADCDDKYRGWYIREVLGSILNSIEKGVDVRGYFHWSLLDNFEWDKGFWPKFGLISVDRKTMKRKLRPSAFVYRDIIKKGTLV